MEGFGVVGRLLFGVVGLELLGVVGRLASDAVRKRGNRCGETVRLSVGPLSQSTKRRIKLISQKQQWDQEGGKLQALRYKDIIMQENDGKRPNSFFGVVPENENFPYCWRRRGVGDGENPFLQYMNLYIVMHGKT